MDALRQYLLSVIAAAIISGCIMSLVGKNLSVNHLIRLLCGIFVTVTILKPVTQFRIPSADELFQNVTDDAQVHIQNGIDEAAREQKRIITQHTEAYILEKASAYNCDLKVCILLSEEAPYEPIGIRLSGAVSPYAKRLLSNWLRESLNIPTEAQEWSG